MNRNRVFYFAAVLVVVVAGLASRRYTGLLPASLGKYPGDALWALMVFLAIGFFKPRWPTWKVAAAALTVSFGVEFSQLYQAPWLDSIRQTTLGHLALGSTFNMHDLTAYVVGVSLSYLAEVALS